MKTIKSTLLVLFVLLMAQIASAYYCPSTGRWLSRDPIGEPGFQALQASSTVSTALLSQKRWIKRDLDKGKAFLKSNSSGRFGTGLQRFDRESLEPAYLFVANAPLDFVDKFGLACFRYRPLGGCASIFGVTGNKEDDKINTVIAHEQLFFEDGAEPANLGFFDDGTLKTETNTKKYRKPHDCGYNDCVMRKAAAGVSPGTYCLLGEDGVAKNNCQDWADKVRAEYKRLVQDPDIQKECSVKPEEKLK